MASRIDRERGIGKEVDNFGHVLPGFQERIDRNPAFDCYLDLMVELGKLGPGIPAVLEKKSAPLLMPR